MARGATVRGSIHLEVEEFDTAVGAGSSQSRILQFFDKLVDLISGTADGSVDRVHTLTGSVGTGTTPLDLVGVFTSQIAGGAATSFAELQLLIIENTSAAGNLLVGGGATPVGITGGTTDPIVVPPGGWHIFYFGTSGLALTGGATDLLKIISSAGTVGFKLYLAGRSA